MEFQKITTDLLNNPAECLALSKKLRARAAALSVLNTDVVEEFLGKPLLAELRLATHGTEIKTLGMLTSLTKEEASRFLKLDQQRFAMLEQKLQHCGLGWNPGCGYCGSGRCVAHTRGESVCGYDYDLD